MEVVAQNTITLIEGENSVGLKINLGKTKVMELLSNEEKTW